MTEEDRGVTSQYAIADSQKMFKMLSSVVYKDSNLTFIREIREMNYENK